jgi:hypothetical protein
MPTNDASSRRSERPVVVMEVWHLKPELADQALALMQQMDRLLGTSTHEHPGWCGHAGFYQRSESPHQIVIVYPWRSRELHEHLISQEEPLLKRFHEKYCTVQREFYYYNQLDVEVEDQQVANKDRI